MCDNGHHIASMQPRGFERIAHDNEVVPCEALPAVDLSLWKDLSDGLSIKGSVGASDAQFGRSFQSYYKK